jgi:hypothetical protein
MAIAVSKTGLGQRHTWHNGDPPMIALSYARNLVLGMAVLLGAASGCTFTAEPGGCFVGGEWFEAGEPFPSPDGCNTCSCDPTGAAACTAMACVDSCTWNGETHFEGEQFPAGDGCNTCTCEPGGSVACTEMGCGNTCEWQGQVYQVGDEFPAGDGCNSCTCDASGDAVCTRLACNACASTGCSIGCEHGGPTIPFGDEVPAGDGCNSCTCADDGSFGCTKVACACNPASEFGRNYVAASPAECAVIDFACPANTKGFANECGCGCEQDLWCPAAFDCMPGPTAGCDFPALTAICPYSDFAL